MEWDKLTDQANAAQNYTVAVPLLEQAIDLCGVTVTPPLPAAADGSPGKWGDSFTLGELWEIANKIPREGNRAYGERKAAALAAAAAAIAAKAKVVPSTPAGA